MKISHRSRRRKAVCSTRVVSHFTTEESEIIEMSQKGPERWGRGGGNIMFSLQKG